MVWNKPIGYIILVDSCTQERTIFDQISEVLICKIVMLWTSVIKIKDKYNFQYEIKTLKDAAFVMSP